MFVLYNKVANFEDSVGYVSILNSNLYTLFPNWFSSTYTVLSIQNGTLPSIASMSAHGGCQEWCSGGVGKMLHFQTEN